MDVQLLRVFDKAQDIDALYKEILRNVKNEDWHWATVSGIWHDFDHLHIFTPMQTSYECATNDRKYVVKEMDKFDLDFLADAQDADLLYKHILEAICNSSEKIQDDSVGWYLIDRLTIHPLYTCILYRSTYNSTNVNRIDKYAMEL